MKPTDREPQEIRRIEPLAMSESFEHLLLSACEPHGEAFSSAIWLRRHVLILLVQRENALRKPLPVDSS
jgi:hypothetical protein